MNGPTEAGLVCHRLNDLYREIDRCLDTGDQDGFMLACLELRGVLAHLRALIDEVSVTDIVYSWI